MKEKHKTQLETLLSGVDLGNITAMDEVLSVNDVPGGSVSFLFEKSSTTAFDMLGDAGDLEEAE